MTHSPPSNRQNSNAIAAPRRLRSLVSFGLVAALVLGIAVDASSQTQKPKTGQQQPKNQKPAQKGKGKKDAAAPAAASASAAAPAPTVTDSVSTPAPMVTATAPLVAASVKPAPPPPPPPTEEQLKNLDQLSKEVQGYQKDARDFRDAITTVVKHHYEMQRRNILSGLDREIATEKTELRRARAEAIQRLEEFIARYSGPNAHPEHTPKAMFQLAALYEERANDGPSEELAIQLKPAIALYKRVLREFPKYSEIAAIYYYLGHALNNSGRAAEAQQVWRSLVCHNKFPYPVATDPADPDKDLVYAKPQDHSTKYWDAWSAMHPDPIGVEKAKAGAKGGKKKAINVPPPKKKNAKEPAVAKDEPLDASDDTTYIPIYGDFCQALPTNEPRYVPEIWWQIGDYHFELQDNPGNPFNYNRAATAYGLSMKSVQDKIKQQVYGVSLYKLAWTYFKQQRYEAAVHQFVKLLDHTDTMEKETGDPGADFRKEAYDYIAGSLTYVDFAGPAEDEPYIVRLDVLDTETDPVKAEQKMRIGIDRVQDPKLIPQDKKWTIEIYKALSREYRELNQLANTTLVLELILQKWPMHRDAPLVQDELAQTYDERARMAKAPEDQQRFAAKALEARSGLAQYVGNTPWVDANRDDPEAIQQAEKLVKGGLRQAAVQHTQNAMAALQEGNQSTDTGTRAAAFERALAEYKLAEVGWNAYLKQDESALDAYETRWWYADAKSWQIIISSTLNKPVAPEQWASARQALVDVRDSNEDDRFLEPSAQRIVALADAAVQAGYAAYKSSNGSQGFPELLDLRKSGEGKDTKIDQTPPPREVLQKIQSMDEYVMRVPPNLDPNQNGPLFRFSSAQILYFYGQWDGPGMAKERFNAIRKDECLDPKANGGKPKSRYGFLAWQKLQAMANINADQSGDSTEARKLAGEEQDPKTSCAVSDADVAIASATTKEIIQGGFYIDAAAAFKKAGDMPDGPDRVKQWRTAGALYEEALKAAPDRDEAPEAAINGAYAYKQVGDYDKAISMYRLFIDKYGDDAILDKLAKGDAKDKARYDERVKNLATAYDALASAYVLFFNYRAAAETLDKIASIDRFPEERRKEAARNSLVLYSNMGDRDKMTAARTKYLSFKPNEEDKAEADYIVAKADLNAWDPTSDSDANRSARNKAMSAMSKYYDDHQRSRAAAKFNTIAAYWVAKMKQQSGQNADDWWKRTIAAFEAYKAGAPTKDGKNEAVGSQQGNMAAEADFTMVDAEIKKSFDYDTGHHRYKGTAVDVIKKYQDDAKDAAKWHDKLKRIADPSTYGSPEYVTAAVARQGSLYDSLRTALFNTREPNLQLFSAQEKKIIDQLLNSGNDDLVDKANAKVDERNQLWRGKRDAELASADQIMIQRYVSAVTIAKKFNVRTAAVTKALQRLAFFTDILGDDKMAQYSQGIEDFTYSPGMFQKMRPGMVAEPDVTPLPAPLPVVPQ